MDLLASKYAEKGDRLKIHEYIGYALGDTASNFFFQMFGIFLIYYYTDVSRIDAGKVALMMLIVRLFDAVNDPIMGLIADRTNTRWGKFRPYILFGAIPYGICGYMMFAGPDFSENGKLIYAYITYALMLMSYTVINVPYSSLMGVLSPSSRTRTVASSYRFVGAFTGGFLISLFVRPLVKYLGGDNKTLGFQLTMAIFAVVSIIMFWITFGVTRERVKPPAGQKTNVKEELGELVHNWPWVMLLIAAVLSTTFMALRGSSTVYYFKYIVGSDDKPLFSVGPLDFDRTSIFLSTGMLAQIAGTIMLGFIARKVDKKYAAGILCTVTALCFMTFYFLPKEQFALLLVVNAIGYLAMGPTSALTWALYGDVADYGEWKFGRRSTGLVFSASLFAIKTGVTVGGFLLPLFLDQFGYVKPPEGTDFTPQTDTAKLGIVLAFSLVPGFIALLKAAALFIYPLNQKQVNEIEQELAARRAAESSGKERE
jgi:GPH family glycoside/pentoside/hexuronide:cation symporter